MKKVKIFFTAAALLVSVLAFAQNITVTGVVTDASNGEPLPGAAILVKGTPDGVVADGFGYYTISVPANATLGFTTIGFKDKEVAVNGRTTLNVALDPDNEMLEETIVIGYGTGQKVGNIVGSVTTVSASDIQNKPSSNIGDALQGKVAGLQIFNTSGEPSSSVSVKLRGNSTITTADLKKSTAPLYILDGVPVSGDVFSTINPQDIENISVLKDASSTAIYGSRASNGVIFISTKKGRKGEAPSVSFRAQYGVSMLTMYKLDMMNSEELIRFEEMCRPELKVDPAYQAQKAYILGNNINFDWTDYLYDKSAPVIQGDLSIRGASEKTTYYISAGYYSEKGTSKANSSMDRFNFRTNVDTQITPWLQVGANLALAYSDYSTIMTGWYTQSPILQAVTGLPYRAPYEIITNPDGTISYGEVMWEYPWDGMMDLNEFYKYNTNTKQDFFLTGQTFVQLTPLKGLTIRSAQAIDADDYDGTSVSKPSFTPYTYNGETSESFSRYYQLSATNTVEYKTNINEKHFFTFLLGQEAIIKHNKGFSLTGTGLTDDRLTAISTTTAVSDWSGNTTECAFNSFFANMNYDYDGRYFVDASVRVDGASYFGKNRKYGTFYSVGGLWRAKNEDFMRGVNWVDDLNVSLSYGTTGGGALSSWYASLGLVGAGSKYNGKSGWGLAQVPNADLTWETVKTLNFAVKGRVFDRVSFDAELYNRASEDIVLKLPYSATTGHTGGYGNVASMTNRGFELSLDIDLIHTRNVYWGISGNVNYNRNFITNLYQGLDELAFPDEGLKWQVGYSSTLDYCAQMAYVDPQDGSPVWYDLNGNYTKQYSDDLQQFWYGHDANSPWSGGFSTNFSWKNFGLSADFSWIGDRYIWLNERYYTRNPQSTLMTSNFERVMLNMWTTPGQITDIPKYDTQFQFDTRAYSNAAFLRMKNITASYSLPKSVTEKMHVLKGGKIYVTGRNLLTFTNFEGYDPEVGYSNGTQGLYPNSRQIVFGAELTF